VSFGHYCIALTNGTRAIEDHDPIYVDSSTGPGTSKRQRVWYPNIAHVVAITEIDTEE
jgi:hypothetical protein